MTATILSEETIAPGMAWAFTMKRGQVLRVTGTSVASLVCFNAHDLSERFDQARTKVYNMRIWISAGERLFSKLNTAMMTMVEDGFAPAGRHDLQYGACSGPILARASVVGDPLRHRYMRGKLAPSHGCSESLAGVVAPFGIEARDVPMPLSLFQDTTIDTASGSIAPTTVRPLEPVTVALRADMDMLVAVSACPDLEAPLGGQNVHCSVVRDDAAAGLYPIATGAGAL